MIFFYWMDGESPKVSEFLRSAASNGIIPKPIGTGRIVPDWHHSLFKQRSLYDAVKGLPEHDLVCATDGFDIFFQRDAEYIREQFLTFGCDVVFSAERGYSHQYRRHQAFFERTATSSPYKYLNAGSVIGYAGALKRLYEPHALLRLKVRLGRSRSCTRLLGGVSTVYEKFLLPEARRTEDPGFYAHWFEYTDQAYLGQSVACGRGEISLELDRGCRMFWCTAFEWEDIDKHYRFVNGRLKNQHTGSTPACVHVPWESKYRSVFLKLHNLVHNQIEA